MKASPLESSIRATLVTCTCANSYIKNMCINISIFYPWGFLRMEFLRMVFLFAPAILPAFTFQWLEHTKNHPSIFFSPQKQWAKCVFALDWWLMHVQTWSRSYRGIMKIIKAVGVKPPTVTGTLERLLTAQDQKRGCQLEGRLRMKLHLPKFRIQKYEWLLVQPSEFKSW